MTQNEYTPTDITPDQDGGVIKQILTLGEGNDSPVPGDRVIVHYVGTLDCGTVFDSSRDRGKHFEFNIGKGEVIKAWDLGVATMKRGEKAKLTCKAEYAYGETGALPKIPPNATLTFEVELYDWKGEDISENKDGSLIRHITSKGTGYTKPNEGALVKIHYVGRYKENVFEDREVEFNEGEGAAIGVIQGLEVAVKKMVQGEKCRLEIMSSMAYGSTGKPEFNIPPDALLHYDVEMLSFEKTKEGWEMDLAEKLEQSEVVKTKGTNYFKDGNYPVAMKFYSKIVGYLKQETPTEDDKKTKKNALMLAAHLNLAMCHLKMDEHFEAKEECEKALEIDSKNVKALFRKGQAHIAAKDYDLAKLEFEKLLKIEPENKAAKNQIIICDKNIKQQKEKEKKLYAGMFQKFADRDSSKPQGKIMDGFADIGEWENSMAHGMLPLDRECEAFGEKMPERHSGSTMLWKMTEKTPQKSPSMQDTSSVNSETKPDSTGDTSSVSPDGVVNGSQTSVEQS